MYIHGCTCDAVCILYYFCMFLYLHVNEINAVYCNLSLCVCVSVSMCSVCACTQVHTLYMCTCKVTI